MTGKAKRQFYGLYKDYFPKIYRYLYYRSGSNREVAEDLVSEVFLKAYERFSQYDQEQPFGPWIYTIARNHLVDHHRTRKDSVPLEAVEFSLATSENIAADTSTKFEVARILEYMERLSEDDREILQLRFLSEYSYDEIAELLGKTTNALQVAVHRALQRIRDLMNEQHP